MTIVVVTHEMASVFMIADRICLLHEGEIKFLGTQEEMKQSDDPYVVQFLERRPDEDQLDPENYLDELVAD